MLENHLRNYCSYKVPDRIKSRKKIDIFRRILQSLLLQAKATWTAHIAICVSECLPELNCHFFFFFFNFISGLLALSRNLSGLGREGKDRAVGRVCLPPPSTEGMNLSGAGLPQGIPWQLFVSPVTIDPLTVTLASGYGHTEIIN